MNILLVDDHAILRAGLRKLLSAVFEGEIYEAANGREAVSLALARKLDLIVLDMNLPDLGGLELLERLLQVSSAAVLVLSMPAEPIYVSRALEAGAQGYISKGAPPEELLTAIRRLVAGGRYVEAELAQALAAQPEARGKLGEAIFARYRAAAATGRRPQPVGDRRCAGPQLQDRSQHLQHYEDQARYVSHGRPRAAGCADQACVTLHYCW